MKRKSVGRLLGWLLLSLLCSALRAANASAAAPNVLFIAIDDLNDWVGCLGGHPQAKTPNIDRLAKRGVLFSHAQCAAPLCNPSRAAVFSGRQPFETGVFANDETDIRKVRPDLVLIPQHFKQAGYRTFGAGKLLHQTSRGLFDDDFFPEQRWSPFKPRQTDYTAEELPSKGTANPRHVVQLAGQTVVLPLNRMPSDRAPLARGGESFDWGPLDVDDAAMGDGQIAAWAAERLRLAHDQPFLLAVGFYRPHIPLFAPKAYFDLYDGVDIQLPTVNDNDLADLSETARTLAIEAETAGAHATVVKYKQWQAAVKAYLACVAFVDAQVGKLLDALDAGPGADNTLVVLWGDHGWHLGEKQHWGKWTGWQRATHVPLIVAPPRNAAAGGYQVGATCTEPVSLIDLYPTLIEVCGLPERGALSGQSLAPLMRRPEQATGRAVITTFGKGNYSVMESRWHYIRYADGNEELYDLTADPHEWTNLGHDPKHAATKQRLAAHCPVPVAAAEPINTKTEPRAQAASISADPNDWPTYNHDFLGTRHNAGEKTLSRSNANQLVEKWSFPPAGSTEKIGVVHATAVVNGHVYFGTETTPTFYKLAPDGKLKWAYHPPERTAPARVAFGLPTAGFMNAALVTSDTVYVGDMGGTIYALNRATGKESWKIDTRAEPFPGAHSSNCVFAAPILAENLVVVAGGAYEHAVAADPKNRGCTGRGFVVALEPQSGRVVWKYDVGPEPQELNPPVTIKHVRGERVFHYGPSTSSVWCTPSYDLESHTVFFGTDCHNSPRQPTADDPRLSTQHSCAVIAVDSRNGSEKWVTQITPDDVWNYAIAPYDPKTGRYKDQSIGDTPKIYIIDVDGGATKVVGCGTKNGGYYVLNAATGAVLANTPIYTGPPNNPPASLDPRTLALPSAIGGLQTGCATDGRAVFTNGIDFLGLGYTPGVRPTGGRVVSISLDTRHENWRHERPIVKAVGGTAEQPAFTNVGDPVGSGIAVANGVAYFTTTVSNRLVAVDTATGGVLKEIELGPVWCGPTVSRGRVYVGTGNLLFSPGNPQEAYFPKSVTGSVRSFGLPGDDETSRMKSGDE